LFDRVNVQARRTLKSDDAEAVHDLRVAIRRFLQALQVFKSLLPGKERKKGRRSLKMLLTEAGEVRNCDITLHFLGEKGHKSIRSQCEAERRSVETALVKSLRRWLEHDSLHFAPGKMAASVEETADQVLPAITRECLKRGVAAAEGASAEQLHHFRISAKKLRYTVELFASRDVRNLRAWLHQIKKVQTLLGDINDCETARQMVSRFGGGKKLDNQLKREQEKRVRDFHQHWTEELAGQWKKRAQMKLHSS
jgi:CHAD domain-containing protein